MAPSLRSVPARARQLLHDNVDSKDDISGLDAVWKEPDSHRRRLVRTSEPQSRFAQVLQRQSTKPAIPAKEASTVSRASRAAKRRADNVADEDDTWLFKPGEHQDDESGRRDGLPAKQSSRGKRRKLDDAEHKDLRTDAQRLVLPPPSPSCDGEMMPLGPPSPGSPLGQSSAKRSVDGGMTSLKERLSAGEIRNSDDGREGEGEMEGSDDMSIIAMINAIGNGSRTRLRIASTHVESQQPGASNNLDRILESQSFLEDPHANAGNKATLRKLGTVVVSLPVEQRSRTMSLQDIVPLPCSPPLQSRLTTGKDKGSSQPARTANSSGPLEDPGPSHLENQSENRRPAKGAKDAGGSSEKEIRPLADSREPFPLSKTPPVPEKDMYVPAMIPDTESEDTDSDSEQPQTPSRTQTPASAWEEGGLQTPPIAVVQVLTWPIQLLTSLMGAAGWTDAGVQWPIRALSQELSTDVARMMRKHVVFLIRYSKQLSECISFAKQADHERASRSGVLAAVTDVRHLTRNICEMVDPQSEECEQDAIEYSNCIEDLFKAVVPGLVLALKYLIGGGVTGGDGGGAGRDEAEFKVAVLAATADLMKQINSIIGSLGKAIQLLSYWHPGRPTWKQEERNHSELASKITALGRNLDLAKPMSNVEVLRMKPRQRKPVSETSTATETTTTAAPTAGVLTLSEKAPSKEAPVSRADTVNDDRPVPAETETAIRQSNRGRSHNKKSAGKPSKRTRQEATEEELRVKQQAQEEMKMHLVRLEARRQAAFKREVERRRQAVRARVNQTMVPKKQNLAQQRRDLPSPSSFRSSPPHPGRSLPDPIHRKSSRPWTTDEISILIDMNRSGTFDVTASARRLDMSVASVREMWARLRDETKRYCEAAGKKMPAWARGDCT